MQPFDRLLFILCHAVSVEEAYRKIALRRCMSQPAGLLVKGGGPGKIHLHPGAQFITEAEVAEGGRIILPGGKGIPFDCLVDIARNPVSVLAAAAEKPLGAGKPLRGGLSQPLDRFFIILRQAVSVEITVSKIALRRRVAETARLLIEFTGSLRTLFHTGPKFITEPEVAEGGRIILLCR